MRACLTGNAYAPIVAPLQLRKANMSSLVRQAEPTRDRLWESQWVDVILALTAASLFMSFDLPGKIPVFTIFAVMSFLASAPTLLALPLGASGFVILPLAAFLSVHIGFSLRVEHPNTTRFVLQAISALMFIWPLVVRYSRRSIAPFGKSFGIFVAVGTIYVALWHISQGHLVSWKRLGEAKTVFNFVPLMVAAFLLSRSEMSKKYGMFVFAAGAVLILLSGERKAYILLAISCPLIFNPRSPFAYVGILLAAALLPVTAALDTSGYVNQQLGTLMGFAEGRVERTISNDLREWQAQYIWKLVHEKPTAGLGTGGYIEIANRYYRGDERSGLGVHGEVMRILIENGAIGLLLYATLVCQGLLNALRPSTQVRMRSGSERKLAFLLVVTCLVYSWLEAFDIRALLSTCLIPFVGYLRLAPQPVAQRDSARQWWSTAVGAARSYRSQVPANKRS